MNACGLDTLLPSARHRSAARPAPDRSRSGYRAAGGHRANSAIRNLGLLVVVLGLVLPLTAADAAKKGKKRADSAGRIETPPPSHPPLQPVELASLPPGVRRLEIFLLLGQSNMKGRGVMPAEPARDPRIVMMHLRDDRWYVARHPLHLTGDAQTFAGHDNAGVGSGLAFAQVLAARDPEVRIALIPCAVGGTSIDVWQKGARRYEDAVRRARLALEQARSIGGVIRGALWLQGEADANETKLPGYPAKLHHLVDSLRADLDAPRLIFVACTIGEFRSGGLQPEMNRLLLALPAQRALTGCVDARDIRTHIGDSVHFDTSAQEEIGRRFAAVYLRLAGSR